MNIFFKNRESFYVESFEDAVNFVFSSGGRPLNIDYVITSDKEKTGKFFLDEKSFLYWLVGNYIWRRRDNAKGDADSFTMALETLQTIWENMNLMPNLIPEGDFLRHEPDSFKIEHLTMKGHEVLFNLSRSGFSEAERKVIKSLLSALIYATF